VIFNLSAGGWVGQESHAAVHSPEKWRDAMMSLFGRSTQPKDVPLSDFSMGHLRDYVDDRWISLAGVGWQGFNNAGRGCVLVDFEEGGTLFVAASNPHLSDSSDATWKDIRKKMKKYNPEKEVVVLHNFVPGNTTTMVLPTPKGMPEPPEAFHLWLRLQQAGAAQQTSWPPILPFS
jgi:hypothetical protein